MYKNDNPRRFQHLAGSSGEFCGCGNVIWMVRAGSATNSTESRLYIDAAASIVTGSAEPTAVKFLAPEIINLRFEAFTLPALSIAVMCNQHRDLLRQLKRHAKTAPARLEPVGSAPHPNWRRP
jgi:hypothetical protein